MDLLSRTSELWEFQTALILRCQLYSNGISVGCRRNGLQTDGSQLKFSFVSAKRSIFVDDWQWQVTVDVFPLTTEKLKAEEELQGVFIYGKREGPLPSSVPTRLCCYFWGGFPRENLSCPLADSLNIAPSVPILKFCESWPTNQSMTRQEITEDVGQTLNNQHH